jgi:hypothetical protein
MIVFWEETQCVHIHGQLAICLFYMLLVSPILSSVASFLLSAACGAMTTLELDFNTHFLEEVQEMFASLFTQHCCFTNSSVRIQNVPWIDYAYLEL